ncbi:hypothetical protein O6H91_04G106900 [Diphasiastrum complanatum]|uniref:Uncharacterized protein n=1 Tax=Diphasiastrum complanatum TaxID=34168 RepID=A0ACC2E0D3_DIPCM|nr:hypothetical protein O6H91_04G106900 [Diphasiastrum complanatum]
MTLLCQFLGWRGKRQRSNPFNIGTNGAGNANASNCNILSRKHNVKESCDNASVTAPNFAVSSPQIACNCQGRLRCQNPHMSLMFQDLDQRQLKQINFAFSPANARNCVLSIKKLEHDSACGEAETTFLEFYFEEHPTEASKMKYDEGNIDASKCSACKEIESRYSPNSRKVSPFPDKIVFNEHFHEENTSVKKVRKKIFGLGEKRKNRDHEHMAAGKCKEYISIFFKALLKLKSSSLNYTTAKDKSTKIGKIQKFMFKFLKNKGVTSCEAHAGNRDQPNSSEVDKEGNPETKDYCQKFPSHENQQTKEVPIGRDMCGISKNDHEQWISTDSDYVVLVLNNA